MLDMKRVLKAKPKKHEEVELQTLFTPWGERLEGGTVLPEHPTPQFQRDNYQVLNGWWNCAFTQMEGGARPSVAEMLRQVEAAAVPGPAAFGQRILVPFSPEAPLSGVGRQLKPGELLWYRRAFTPPALTPGNRLLLHFQAVDHTCSCRVNGTMVGTHAGGYLPFAFDITDCLRADGNEITLCVADGSELGGQLRGKQRLDRGDIWYTAQSGIWQTVWLEVVPANRIERMGIRTDAGGNVRVELTLHLGNTNRIPQTASVELFDAAGTAAAFGAAPIEGSTATVDLQVEEPRLWHPEDPHLYRVMATCGADVVQGYCGIRTVEVRPDADGQPRFHLNGAPLFLKGVLDQGYWPDGLMTAPADAALVADIEAARDAGFNLIRKHIKVENARWYHHCDRLGMLVLQDMVNGGDAGPNSWQWSYKPTLFKASWNRYADNTPAHMRALGGDNPAYQREWRETCAQAIACLGNHPCIIGWSLFNEGWGQFRSREAIWMAATLDPTRPIDATSGWYDQGDGHFKSVHNYFRPLQVWPDRGRRAFFISECGGLTLHVPQHSALAKAYGYEAFDGLDAWRRAFRETMETLDDLEDEGLAGFVYTQLSDIEEETNGILTYDRRVNKLENADVGKERA